MWCNVTLTQVMRLKCWTGKRNWVLKECAKTLGAGSRRILAGMVKRDVDRRASLAMMGKLLAMPFVWLEIAVSLRRC